MNKNTNITFVLFAFLIIQLVLRLKHRQNIFSEKMFFKSF